MICNFFLILKTLWNIQTMPNVGFIEDLQIKANICFTFLFENVIIFWICGWLWKLQRWAQKVASLALNNFPTTHIYKLHYLWLSSKDTMFTWSIKIISDKYVILKYNLSVSANIFVHREELIRENKHVFPTITLFKTRNVMQDIVRDDDTLY